MAPTEIANTAKPAAASARLQEGIARSKQVQQEILAIGDAYRARHPWLARHTDLIGFSIFTLSCAAIVGTATAYGYGLLSAWLTVPAIAFFMSLLHELEHDLIHYMYFRKNAFMHNLMMAGVYLFRPSTINPWVRRKLHLHHHKFSGTESDLEERGITNGEPWGLRRLLMTGDNMLAIYLRPIATVKMVHAFLKAQKNATPGEIRRLRLANLLGYSPLGNLYYLGWHGIVAWTLVSATAAALGAPIIPDAFWQQVIDVTSFFAVVLMLPNVLRTFCLHFVSSNMHYYGDVDPRDIVQQTQVWTAWWLAPLHLFCFNFGATHAIHHFVVRDPFYLRQLTAREVYPVLRRHGVRFNDFGTFLRANRQHAAPQAEAAAVTA